MKSNLVSIAGFLNSKKLLDSEKKKGENSLAKNSSQKSLSRSFLNSNSKVKQDDENMTIRSSKNNFNTKNNLRSYNKEQINNQQSHSASKFRNHTVNQFEIQTPNNIIPISNSTITTSKVKLSNRQQITTSHLKNYENKIPQQSYEYQQPPTLNPNKKTSLWGDVTNVNNNFNSSRLQSKQCLQNLSRKILKQLQTIQSTIQIFSRKMQDTLKQQYSKLNFSIKQSIDKIFQLYQQDIFDLAHKEEQNANQQFYATKKQLENMYVKIEKMKEGIQTQNWKKIAGELLSSQLEEQVQNLLRKCEKKTNLTNITLQLDKRKSDVFQESLSNLLKVKIVRSTLKTEDRRFFRSNLNDY